MKHEIIVGNIGTVYCGPKSRIAKIKFDEYKGHSEVNYGRASGESVTWLINGEIHKEFIGRLEKENNDV